MKTLKKSISQEEENQIFDSLIEKFDLNKSDIFAKGQTINFPFTEDVEVWATLDLYQYGYIEDDTNASIITERYVCKFTLDFYIAGETIEVLRNNKVNESIEDKVSNNYRI